MASSLQIEESRRAMARRMACSGAGCVMMIRLALPSSGASFWSMEAMETDSVLLDGALTPEQLMAVVAKSRLCLSMRLHTLIFAARVSVPMAGLVYDPKVSSYLEELDMPAAGDVTDFDPDAACRVLDDLLADYDARRADLAERSAALTAAAGENERLLLELLEK